MRHWGIISLGSGGGIVGVMVNSVDKGETVQIGSARNESGAVTDMGAYSRENTITVGGVLDTPDGAAVGVRAGVVISLGGMAYLVNQSDQNESNEAYVSVTIGGVTADGANLRDIDGAITSGAVVSSGGQ